MRTTPASSWFLVCLVGCSSAATRNPVSTGDLADDGEAASSDESSGTPPSEDGADEGWDDGFCENGPLFYGPLPLPAARLGHPYEVDVQHYADDRWGGVDYTLDDFDAPPGLELDPGWEALRLHGIPTELGEHVFTIEAVHDVDENGCSTAPDPHEFTLAVFDPSVLCESFGERQRACLVLSDMDTIAQMRACEVDLFLGSSFTEACGDAVTAYYECRAAEACEVPGCAERADAMAIACPGVFEDSDE